MRDNKVKPLTEAKTRRKFILICDKSDDAMVGDGRAGVVGWRVQAIDECVSQSRMRHTIDPKRQQNDENH